MAVPAGWLPIAANGWLSIGREQVALYAARALAQYSPRDDKRVANKPIMDFAIAWNPQYCELLATPMFTNATLGRPTALPAN